MTSWICAARQAPRSPSTGGRRAGRSGGCRRPTRGRGAGPGLTTPMASRSDCLREVADVVAVDADRAAGHVVEPGDRARRPWSCRRPTVRRGRRAGRARSSSVDVAEHRTRRGVGHRTGRPGGLERGQRRPRWPPGSGTRRRRARCDPRGRRGRRRRGGRRSAFGVSSTSKTRSKRHERRHDVDPGVGEARERVVDAGHEARPGRRACRAVIVPVMTSCPPMP